MKSFYFLAVRATGEVFAIEPKTLFTCHLSGNRPARVTPEALGLPGGFYKARRAQEWELEPLRQALEFQHGDRVKARGYQPPGYVSRYLAREPVDLPAELEKLRAKANSKQSKRREKHKVTAGEHRRTRQQQQARVLLTRVFDTQTGEEK